MSESHRRQWRPSTKQWLVLRISVLIVGAGVAAFVILSAVSSTSVPAETYVDGVDIGGLSRDEAITVVRERIAKAAARPLEFEEDGQQIVVKPRQAGGWVNAEKTVDPLLAGRFQWIADLLGTERTNVEPVVIVEEEKMSRQIAVFERLLTTTPVASSLSVNGSSVDYSPGRQGTTVDVEELANSIRSLVTEPRAKAERRMQRREANERARTEAAREHRKRQQRWEQPWSHHMAKSSHERQWSQSLRGTGIMGFSACCELGT